MAGWTMDAFPRQPVDADVEKAADGESEDRQPDERQGLVGHDGVGEMAVGHRMEC